MLLINLDQFGFASGLGPAPKYWCVGFFMATVVLFLPGMRLEKLIRTPIFWWTVGYFSVSIMWVGLADDLESAKNGLMMVVMTCLYIWTGLLAYSHMDSSDRVWGFVLWTVLLMASISIYIEYFEPSFFIFAKSGQGIPGRAAGLYLNPNIAAQAIVMVMAWLMMRGSPVENIGALLIAFVAMILTVSRAGLIVLMFLTVVATIFGRLPRWFLLVLSGISTIVILFGAQILDVLSAFLSSENKDALGRLAWLLGQGNLNDYSADERGYLVGFAWRKFQEAPVLGHGLGYMWVWDFKTGTHNMFLRYMVEYGAIGICIFPLFVFCCIRSRSESSGRGWLLVAGAISLFLGFFSHNMLEQNGFLLPLLGMCLMRSSGKRCSSGMHAT